VKLATLDVSLGRAPDLPRVTDGVDRQLRIDGPHDVLLDQAVPQQVGVAHGYGHVDDEIRAEYQITNADHHDDDEGEPVEVQRVHRLDDEVGVDGNDNHAEQDRGDLVEPAIGGVKTGGRTAQIVNFTTR
jgi:hypothetical protein